MGKLVLLLCVISLSGCASISQTFMKEPFISNKNNRIYAGVRLDIKSIAVPFENDWDCSSFDVKPHCYLFPLSIIDVPLSAVFDTIFLPYTLTHYYINHPKQTNQNAREGR
jgi:uncharacterized protein YceK